MSKLPDGLKLWIDPGVDGFHRPYADSLNREWKQHIRRFPGYRHIGDPAFHENPDLGRVEEFVFAVLAECTEFKPRAITIPQLPIVSDASRNKMNRALAAAAAKWRSNGKYDGWMILPAVFTDQSQVNLKTARNRKRDVIRSCYEKSEASGLWAVDSTLQDQAGSATFRNRRFPGLVAFHEEIIEHLPEGGITIAGPYWGMNLVLWVKGLCRFPAIGVGAGYQYHLAGGRAQQAKVRLALPPLRRWSRVGGLRDWLKDALKQIDKSDSAYADFAHLLDNFTTLGDKQVSREQIARFYKGWFDEIEAAPKAGRALALYQMLSSAYVLGKALPSLPSSEKTARRPERVAEYLMLNCL
ncbi:MAG TPA: hypothetical protein VMY37_00370 [Thermoguttaceae bacterium]|nr:hypothetical protein [Thermoguttaceae bacterium]